MSSTRSNNVRACLTGVVGLLMAMQVQAAEFVVDTTVGGGSSCDPAVSADCSLGGALVRVKATPGDDLITFNIPASDPGCDANGVCTVVSGAVWTDTGGGVVFDGYTQPGASVNTLPLGQGTNAQLKIVLANSNLDFNVPVTMRGLVFKNSLPFNREGIGIGYYGNFFGLEADGVTLQADANLPFNAYIESDVAVQGLDIGSGAPADVNLFGGNAATEKPGFCLRPRSKAVRIRGNLIGSDRTGKLARGCQIGISIEGTSATPGLEVPHRIEDNIIVGQSRYAIGHGSTNVMTYIRNNRIGIGVDDTPLPNYPQAGIADSQIFGPFQNTFARIEGNLFAFHTSNAIGGRVGDASSGPGLWEVLGNRFLAGHGQPIDMLSRSDTVLRLPNDPGDPDDSSSGGPGRISRYQNFPDISAFSRNGDLLELTYSVDSLPANTTYPLTIEFYRDDGYGNFEPLGRDTYAEAEAQTSVTATIPLPDGIDIDATHVIVASAITSPPGSNPSGETSEFSYYPLLLEIGPLPTAPPAGVPFNVPVTATAQAGPFKPNGVVTLQINTNPSSSCELRLQPGAGAFESTGSCALVPTQAGNRTITATYDTRQGSFGSVLGGNVTGSTVLLVGQPGPEQISFASCRAVALEGRDLLIRIARPSGAPTNVSVALDHIAGTATAGTDYTAPATQTLSWAAGDMAAKVVTIPIASDGIAEPVETFRLRLTNPVNTAILPHALMEVSILDGDEQGFRDGFEGDCPL